jgi:hypothetical protein
LTRRQIIKMGIQKKSLADDDDEAERKMLVQFRDPIAMSQSEEVMVRSIVQETIEQDQSPLVFEELFEDHAQVNEERDVQIDDPDELSTAQSDDERDSYGIATSMSSERRIQELIDEANGQDEISGWSSDEVLTAPSSKGEAKLCIETDFSTLPLSDECAADEQPYDLPCNSEDQYEEFLEEDLILPEQESFTFAEHEQAMKKLNSKWNKLLLITEQQLMEQSKLFQEERSVFMESQVAQTAAHLEKEREKKLADELATLKLRFECMKGAYELELHELRARSDKEVWELRSEIVDKESEKEASLAELRAQLMHFSDDQKGRQILEQSEKDSIAAAERARVEQSHEWNSRVEEIRSELRATLEQEKAEAMKAFEEQLEKEKSDALEAHIVQLEKEKAETLESYRAEVNEKQARAVSDAVVKFMDARDKMCNEQKMEIKSICDEHQAECAELKSICEQTLADMKDQHQLDLEYQAECYEIKMIEIETKHVQEVSSLKEKLTERRDCGTVKSAVEDAFNEIDKKRTDSKKELENAVQEAVRLAEAAYKVKLQSQHEEMESMKDRFIEEISEKDKEIRLLLSAHQDEVQFLRSAGERELQEIKDHYRYEMSMMEFENDCALVESSSMASSIHEKSRSEIKSLKSQLAELASPSSCTDVDVQAAIKLAETRLREEQELYIIGLRSDFFREKQVAINDAIRDAKFSADIELECLRQVIDEEKARVEQLEKENEDAKFSADIELECLRQVIGEEKSRADQLESKLVKLRIEESDARIELESMRKEGMQLQKKQEESLKALMDEVAAGGRQTAEMEKAMIQLQEKYEEEIAQLKETHSSEQESMIEKSNTIVSRLRNDLEIALNEVSEVANEARRIDELKSRKIQEVKSLLEQVMSERSSELELVRENNSLEIARTIRAHEKALDDVQKELAIQQLKTNDQESKVLQLSHEVNNLRQALEEAKNVQIDVEISKKQLQEDLISLESEKQSALIAIKTELEAKLSASEEASVNVSAAIERAIAECSDELETKYVEGVETLRHDLADTKQQRSILEARMSALTYEHEEATSRLQSLVDGLTSELADIKMQRLMLESRISALTFKHEEDFSRLECQAMEEKTEIERRHKEQLVKLEATKEAENIAHLTELENKLVASERASVDVNTEIEKAVAECSNKIETMYVESIESLKFALHESEKQRCLLENRIAALTDQHAEAMSHIQDKAAEDIQAAESRFAIERAKLVSDKEDALNLLRTQLEEKLRSSEQASAEVNAAIKMSVSESSDKIETKYIESIESLKCALADSEEQRSILESHILALTYEHNGATTLLQYQAAQEIHATEKRYQIELARLQSENEATLRLLQTELETKLQESEQASADFDAAINRAVAACTEEVEARFAESVTILRRQLADSEQHHSVLETRISSLTSQHEEAMVRLQDAALVEERLAESRHRAKLSKLELDKEAALLTLRAELEDKLNELVVLGVAERSGEMEAKYLEVVESMRHKQQEAEKQKSVLENRILELISEHEQEMSWLQRKVADEKNSIESCYQVELVKLESEKEAAPDLLGKEGTTALTGTDAANHSVAMENAVESLRVAMAEEKRVALCDLEAQLSEQIAKLKQEFNGTKDGHEQQVEALQHQASVDRAELVDNYASQIEALEAKIAEAGTDYSGRDKIEKFYTSKMLEQEGTYKQEMHTLVSKYEAILVTMNDRAVAEKAELYNTISIQFNERLDVEVIEAMAEMKRDMASSNVYDSKQKVAFEIERLELIESMQQSQSETKEKLESELSAVVVGREEAIAELSKLREAQGLHPETSRQPLTVYTDSVSRASDEICLIGTPGGSTVRSVESHLSQSPTSAFRRYEPQKRESPTSHPASRKVHTSKSVPTSGIRARKTGLPSLSRPRTVAGVASLSENDENTSSTANRTIGLPRPRVGIERHPETPTFPRNRSGPLQSKTGSTPMPSTNPRSSSTNNLDVLPRRKGGLIAPRAGLVSPKDIRAQIGQPKKDVCNADVKIMVLVTMTPKVRKLIDGLGVTLIEDIDKASSATHVIAGDSDSGIRRTPKLMIALCSTSNILSLEWLVESSKAKTLLNPGKYLLLNDKVGEGRYGISMKRTLASGKERRKEGGLLAGWTILFCHGVAGNQAPSQDELDMVVRAAGGKVLMTWQLPILDRCKAQRTIVITSHPLLAEQISSSEITQVISDGAGLPQTIKWLFDCIMHQKLIGLGL